MEAIVFQMGCTGKTAEAGWQLEWQAARQIHLSDRLESSLEIRGREGRRESSLGGRIPLNSTGHVQVRLT